MSGPPRVARALLRVLTPRMDRPFVLPDLEERFHEIRERRGVRVARWWYRRQAVVSLPALLSVSVTELGRASRSGDVRRAIRLLGRRPQFAAGVAGTLSLGCASAIVLGGLAWQVWLAPLPLPDSERLVRVYELEPADEAGVRVRYRPSPPLLREFGDHDWTHFSGFASSLQSAPEWIVDGEIRHLRGAFVSPGFFGVLGITPLHGRADWGGGQGAEPAEAILSEEFWMRAFGGDPAVLGTRIDLAGELHEIVGVVRYAGGYPEDVDLFTPLVWTPDQVGVGFRGARYVEAIARVAPSSSVDAAGQELERFLASLGEVWPTHAGWSGEIVSLRTDLVGSFRASLRLLLVAGVAFLCLSLVNVLGLAAARALEGSRDVAVRTALGASQGRLRREALTEGAVLGFLGGASAVLLARVLMAASVAWLPEDLPRSADVGLSLAQGGAWIVAATVLGALLNALAHRVVPAGPLRMGGTRVSRDLFGGRALVVGQFALTTLLVGSGALVLERSLDLADRDLGFATNDVWTGLVALPRTSNEGWEERRDTWGALLRGLEDRGYQAAIATNPPMAGSNNRYDYRRSAEDEQSFGQYSIVSPDYFDVMGIDIVAGRAFAPGDVAPSVIISEALADEVFPDENPVGLTLSILQLDREIIGVATSTAHFGPDAASPPSMYVSYEAENWAFTRVVVKGDEGVPGAIASALAEAAPGAAEPTIIPYRRHLAEWFRPLRLQLGIVGALGLAGGLLAALGLYSAISFQVRGRLPELGIRMALGATRTSIVTGVIQRGVATAALGLGLGAALWWLARDALAQAIGAAGTILSPFAIGTTALAIVSLALVAVSLPARRAAAADPLESFRAQ